MRKRVVVIALAAAGAVSFAVGVLARPVGPVAFTVQNLGGSDLEALRLSRPDAESWGPDRLVTAPVTPGDAKRVDLSPGLGGCLYDLKAEFASGGEARLFRVDVCRLNGRVLSLVD